MLTALFTVWVMYLGAMVSPGPNILLVSQLAAGRDRNSARFAGIGVAVGAGIWAACSVLGVNAVFLAFPWLRLSLQFAGGIYLIYMAVNLWRAQRTQLHGSLNAASRFTAFRLGFLTNITNPKAALFFGSVFATALPPHPTIGLQVGSVIVVVASALAWYFLLAQLFSSQKIRNAYGRIAAATNRIVSALFGVLGATLLIATYKELRAHQSPPVG